MMRRLLGFAVVGVGLLASSGANRTASAIVCVNCAQELTQQLSWGQNWIEMGKQLDEARRTFNVVQADYQQAQMVWNAASRVTDLGSAVGALSTIGIQNPLPVNPWALQGLLNGTGGVQGGISNLSSLFTGTQMGNQVYAVQPGTFARDEMIRRGASYSGAQAVALQLHESAAQRSPLLAQLLSRLDTARDPTEREAIMVRLQAEQAQIANQSVQAAAAGNFQAAQMEIDRVRQEQRLQQSIDEALIVIDGRSGAVPAAPVMTARVGG